jgi:hypothetical protein
MTHKNLFTTDEIWKGGHYELLILPRTNSSKELCSLLEALWTSPSLEGCSLRKDCEPATQKRVQPCERDAKEHLYGLATLPSQRIIACGSYAMDYAGESDSPPAHWVSFYLTMSALSTAYPVGAYPFGPMDKVSEWKAEVDSFLTHVAGWIYRAAPFDFALVGFEVDTSSALPEQIRANGIPKERDAGILWNGGSGLKWYPATRP